MSTASDAPPPDVSIRAKPPSPRRLNRKVLLSGALLVGGVVAFALAAGLGERPDQGAADAQAVAAAAGPPESIEGAASQYKAEDMPDGGPTAPDGDMLWGDHKPPEELQPPEDAVWTARASGAQGSGGRAGADAAPDPQALARTAPILFRGGSDGRDDRSGGEAGALGGSGPRAAFLASQRADRDTRLPEKLSPPRSRYELIAGAVIPAALITELNSDLPGRVIAQVTTPVYDSVSGDHLLIPQGARLLGTYDSAATYGDRRLLLVWNRLVFPNGWSISLRGMEGSGPSGAAGLTDRTDHHLDRLAGAIGLSAIISVIANEAEGDKANVSVRPTLRIRVGGAVRVLVTRDIQLRPYRGEAPR
ncbi:MAG: type IV secretion system protein VirB10 [Alphaproteobacteria bacterium]|nr:MAG: type IV secretion system protein VirB10 [Alphaproteobacteria bacterium]